MKNILIAILFFPKRYYYAMLSPETQFKKLIRVIKKEHPLFYEDFEILLKKRFFIINHPKDLHGASIPIGEGKEIQAFFSENRPSIFLNDVSKKKIIEKSQFQSSYYGPGMH